MQRSSFVLERAARGTKLAQRVETPPNQSTDFSLPTSSLTSWLSHRVANLTVDHVSGTAIHRSKRMIMDCIGVGVLGSQTELCVNIRGLAKVMDGPGQEKQCSVLGVKNKKCSAPMAAYLNGISCHAMDYDDTWHPATHPSGPVLPAVMAAAEALPGNLQPTLQDILVAFNVGVDVQGHLLRCSTEANNIPNRLHPPAIVGVMGSAAAVARLLGLGPQKCRHALAIAASFAGAPMANAGTTTKPLHAGKAARFGLEAALLADIGIEGNTDILDIPSGFPAYFNDFRPERCFENNFDEENVILHNQDVAIKRFPCHLGMHWGIDAASEVNTRIHESFDHIPVQHIRNINIIAPKSKYINRPIPTSDHDARHSFQFTVCSALFDSLVTPNTFNVAYRNRESLRNLLGKTSILSPNDNVPSFDRMYVEVIVTLSDGHVIHSRCDTPYGHWRRPLTDSDVISKFTKNTNGIIGNPSVIVDVLSKMKHSDKVADICELLQ